MQRVKFNNCLNLEVKFYNISVGAIVGAVVIGSVFWIIKGFIGLAIGGVVGFYAGKYLMNQFWRGNIQRYLYWNFPNIFCDKSKPASSIRHFM